MKEKSEKKISHIHPLGGGMKKDEGVETTDFLKSPDQCLGKSQYLIVLAVLDDSAFFHTPLL